MLLSQKQIEFCQNMYHRWNFKGGATRSGKTYLDFRWIIPLRIRERVGRDGLVVILGVTKSTIERNVLEPMRNIFGSDIVGTISSDNTAWIFGERCYCLGAEKVSQVSKIRGASIKYCYGDEVADWSEEVFTMLKSRLDKEYSTFDGTYNPAFPTHWLKQFLDSDADIYNQRYTIDDNPFLPESFRENLKNEYRGTIFYDRYILGLWKRAEGTIYTAFADNPQAFAISKDQAKEECLTARYLTIGVDFGGNKSKHAFCATLIGRDWSVTPLRSSTMVATGKSVDDLINEFIRFCAGIERDYGQIYGVWADCAEQAIINSMDSRTKWSIRGSVKGAILDRIRATDIMMNSGRFRYVDGECETLKSALTDAVWDDDEMDCVRLDDGTSDVDSLDAFEYSWSWAIKQIVRE